VASPNLRGQRYAPLIYRVDLFVTSTGVTEITRFSIYFISVRQIL
jgi:hypothetical protein